MTWSESKLVKDTESKSSWVGLGGVDTESEGLETTFGSKLRIEEFGLLTSRVGCGAI